MNKISAYLNIIMIGILLILLIPALPVQAITATPTTPVPGATDTPTPAIVGDSMLTGGCDTARTVQTSGTAVINVVPDRALIQLGVQTNATTTKEVTRQNNGAIQKVISALEELDIQPTDIATDWYFIEPVYSSYDSLNIKGYRINNTLGVMLRDISQINLVITAALEAGANQVLGVELYPSELRKYRDQARDAAVKAAREKAEALSTAAGAQVGCIISLNENVWSYYNGWYGSGQGGRDVWSQNVIQNAGPTGEQGMLTESGAVTLGQVSVRAEVTTVYSLR